MDSATTARPGVGDSIPAPRARLSKDGHTAIAGEHRLTVSSADRLDPKGATVTVTGTGYDTFKGIYVAFCVEPKQNQVPTPCGGGADTAGESGASQWISSNPPPYGRGLAVAYGPDGSFTATLHIGAPLNTKVDCRDVQCAVTTRNDHIRTTDRSQDLFVPVSFRGSRLVSVASDTAGGGSTDSGGAALPLGIGAAVVIGVGIAVGVFLARRRRARQDAATTTAPSVSVP